MRSHLEQVRDAFSSCESRNFPPAWGVLARSLDPCRSRVGCHTGNRLFCFDMDGFASSRRPRETVAAACFRRETRGVCDRHASMGVPNVALP
jgi:hypothetical protein